MGKGIAMGKTGVGAAGVWLAMIVMISGCQDRAPVFNGAKLRVSGAIADYLRCEYLADPLGIDTAKPRLSWVMESGRRGQMQSAYQIQAASCPKLLADGQADLWDTGKVVSDKSNQIEYAGRPLTSRMRCWWRVRVCDQDGRVSRWSEPAFWSMGLLEPGDWKAKWIGFDASRDRSITQLDISLTGAKWIWYPEGEPAVSAPVGVRYFRKVFEIAEGQKVKSAVCLLTADNRYKLFMNERRTRDGENFKQAFAIDVTERLKAGKNVIGIEVTNDGTSPNPAGVIVVLKVDFEAGEPIVLKTDGSWISCDKYSADWMNIDKDAKDWVAAKVLGEYGCKPWEQVEVAYDRMFLPPAQFLRKGFVADRAIRRAVVYASALGNYELHVNGQRVENAYFTPGWTDYKIRVYYNTFDVTGLVKRGDNVIGAMLADGWYSGHIGWGHKRDHYGANPRLLVQLHVDYEDGTSQVIATDGSWKATTGPILEGDFLMGEAYDARKEMPGWSAAGFDDSGWKKVDVTDKIAAKIQSYPGVLVRPFKEIKPAKVTEPTPGACVFDMGTNLAGFVRLKVRGGQAGERIVLRFAERLNTDGTIYTTNLRGARATDTYICRGGGVEVWQPRFTFHGFQYVEVTGYPGKPALDAITGVELTSATLVVGGFECSDAMANTLYRNICQTQRANFIDIPTDCPQRDERLGWMGDAQIYVRTATYNTDVAAFFNKWLVDVEDAQLANGQFSDVSPRCVAMGGGVAAWGDAGVICPWAIYQVYGDRRVLEEHYDAMQRWIEFCKGTTKELLRPEYGYGDWLSINAETPKDVLATAYFAYSTKLTAKVAEVLGKKDDAAKYNQLFEDIKAAFNKAYVAEDGRIKGNTQTVYVLALAFDLLPEGKRLRAVKYLIDDIKGRDWHLSTGFVGTKDLMATLTRFGRTYVAYKLFHNDTFPSWGFSIRHGATSIWERWDGWTPEKGFQDPGMNSFAHYSFGAVGEWMFKTIAGIDTDGPGYKEIVIHPRPGGNLTYAKASYDSIYGPIVTAWQITDGTFSLDVTIPANTTAMVYVPARDAGSVTEGGVPAGQARGVRPVSTDETTVVFEIGSGSYRFVSKLQ
jgi:alpha-L-rhamnosidase